MNWQATLSWEDAKRKAAVLKQIREFFYQRDVIEVETPLIGQYSVTDIHLDAFTTHFNYFSDSPSDQSDILYLQTSPEFCMKRLLACGYQSIYQMSKAFRHECKGRYHNPEFTILEWYRVGFEQEELINEVSDLLMTVLKCNQPAVMSYQKIFLEYIGVDPLDTDTEELKQVIQHSNKLSDWLIEETNIDVLLQFILSELIEPQIGLYEPVFIYNFPITQASLAKQNTIDDRVSDRFECYFKGVELVNGFCELTDATEQIKRFKHDNATRKAQGLSEKEIDYRFIDALKAGIPMCSGVALGIDRLLMIALNKTQIDDVITFTIDRA